MIGGTVPDWITRHFSSLSDVVPLPASGQKHVYFAIEQEKAVVLKTFKADARERRSLREIEMASRIKSARVPRLLAHGAVDLDGGHILWLKEERLPGDSVRHRMKDGPLEWNSIYTVCDHVLEALEDAEAQRVVHRDVKPENIILAHDKTQAWLVDFGIARDLGSESITGTENIFGPCTFGYASPEQIHNRKGEIDSRSDLFSLAITIYELSEGENPLLAGANGPMEIADRTENFPLPRLRNVKDQRFADLIEAMSRARRDHRPKNVAEARAWFREISPARCDR